MGWFSGSRQQALSHNDFMEIVRTKWSPLKVWTVREVYGTDGEWSTEELMELNDVKGRNGNG
jgi:hypothetical protein